MDGQRHLRRAGFEDRLSGQPDGQPDSVFQVAGGGVANGALAVVIMTPKLFRCLVISWFLLSLAAGAIDWLFPSLISASLNKALETTREADFIREHLFIFAFIGIPWLLLFFAGAFGLLFFKRWARPAALYSTLIGLVLFPFTGPSLSSGLANSLNEASLLLWGAVLAVAYFSPLSERFSAEKITSSE